MCVEGVCVCISVYIYLYQWHVLLNGEKISRCLFSIYFLYSTKGSYFLTCCYYKTYMWIVQKYLVDPVRSKQMVAVSNHGVRLTKSSYCECHSDSFLCAQVLILLISFSSLTSILIFKPLFHFWGIFIKTQ